MPDQQRSLTEQPLQAQFTIDPQEEEFKKLRSVCEPGNPWRCLIATMGSLQLGKRMSVRLDHEKGTGIIGVTHGDLRYERPMTPEEVSFARRFDLGRNMRKPLTVKVDLRDGTWTSKPKAKTGGRGGHSTNRKHTETIRARQLAAIRAAHQRAQEGGEQ